jgi:hypothetical protein
MHKAYPRWAAAFSIGILAWSPVMAEDDADELARKVSNPASFMISVPVHSDFDFGRWSDGSLFSNSLDIEPVIPFSLNADWNVISHTDFPLLYSDPVGPGGREFGLGDISQNLSITPSTHGPLIWAFGPQFSLPTATRDEFGSGKLSIGPSGLLLLQTKSMSIGASGSHMWSVLGDGSRPDVSQTEIQPFIAWHIGEGRTISANIDYTYDWVADDWTLPASLSFSKIVKLGEQTMSLSIGGKYWIDPPRNGPEWGIKAGVTFLFPQAAPPR